MKKILVVGSMNMDLTINTTKIPTIGETILGKNFLQSPGGKGANQAVTMARLGADVTMIGRVGDDDFGSTLLETVQGDNIDTVGIEKLKDVSTGVASILVDEAAHNTITVVPGANFQINEMDIDKYKDLYKLADIVVHQLETPLKVVEHSLELAKSMGKTTVLNPAPAKKLADSMISNIDYLIPNETELELLSGVQIKSESDIISAAKSILLRGVAKLIVTLGAKGSIYIDGNQLHQVKAYEVDAVDTTAAGDSFIGGFITCLAKGMPLAKSLQFATKVAAITVTRKGAQASLPMLEDIENFVT